MAATKKDSTALSAAVIILTVVCIFLLGFVGYFMYSSMTATKSAEEAATKLVQANDTLSKQSFKLQYLLHTAGDAKTEAELESLKGQIGDDADVRDIQEKYEKNMTLFGPNTAKSEQTYPNLVESLMKVLRQRNLELKSATEQLEEAKTKIESVIAQETAAREKAEAKSAELAKDLSNARDEYKAKEDDLKATINTLTEEKTEIAQKHQKAEAKLRGDLENIKTENAALLKFKTEVIAQRIENEREDFASAQGKVVGVDAKGVQLWINLGQKDGLKVGQRFAILNSDTIRVTESVPKAHIEITRITGPHESQARVIKDRLNVPVITEDLVYSQTWQAGSKTRYALLGLMDTNGDSLDDRALVRSMIEQNGGMVVEDIGPDTKSVAKPNIDINTTYLVIGGFPSALDSGDLDANSKSLVDKYLVVRRKAKEVGVREISLQNLLGQLKKYDDDRTIAIGDGLSSADFIERAPAGRSSNYGIRPAGPLSGPGDRQP